MSALPPIADMLSVGIDVRGRKNAECKNKHTNEMRFFSDLRRIDFIEFVPRSINSLSAI